MTKATNTSDNTQITLQLSRVKLAQSRKMKLKEICERKPVLRAELEIFH